MLSAQFALELEREYEAVLNFRHNSERCGKIQKYDILDIFEVDEIYVTGARKRPRMKMRVGASADSQKAGETTNLTNQHCRYSSVRLMAGWRFWVGESPRRRQGDYRER